MQKRLKRPARKSSNNNQSVVWTAFKSPKNRQIGSKIYLKQESSEADKGVGQLDGVLKFEFLSCLHYFKYIPYKTRIFTAQIKFWLRESDNKA